MVSLSAAAIAATHPVHIRGIGTVIVAVVVLLPGAAAITWAVRRARGAGRTPPPGDWQPGLPQRDREVPRTWQ